MAISFFVCLGVFDIKGVEIQGGKGGFMLRSIAIVGIGLANSGK